MTRPEIALHLRHPLSLDALTLVIRLLPGRPAPEPRAKRAISGRPSDAQRPPSKWLTLLAACLGLGMLMIDTFVVNVALPAIGRDLGAGPGAVEWTVSGYVLMIGVMPLAMGRLGDIFGRRRVYMAGLLGFIVTSVACALAADIGQLVVCRVLQGIAAATMFPGTLSIITQAFPPAQRGLAIGTWGGVSGLGLIAGPVLGGLLVRGDDWRAIFLVNLPVGLLALLMAAQFVGESRDESAPRRVDWAGLGLLGAGLLALMLGLTHANELGWTAPITLAGFAGGTLLLALFVAVERRVPTPLVDLGLFRNGSFVMGCLAAFLFSAAVFGVQPYTSLFMQNYWGFTPLEGGLAFLPGTTFVALLMPFGGIIGQRLGRHLRLVIIVGSLLVGASFLYLVRLEPASGYVDGFLPALVLRGIGIGLTMSSTSLAVVSALPEAKSGLASGTLTMARNVGTALGIALFGSVYNSYVAGVTAVRLADQPASELERLTAAASRFSALGTGPVAAAMRSVVVDGFVAISVAGVLLCLVATAAAACIRFRRAPLAAPAAAAAAAREEGAASPAG